MEATIKQVIDARKSAIFSSYTITDQAMIDKIEDLFKRINEFGNNYNDLTKFETDFAQSPLNGEYTNIFVEIAQNEVEASKPSMGEMLADRVGSNIKNRIMPSRAVMSDARDQAIRNIPVVGDIVDAKQKIDFFKRFKKNK